MIKITLPDGSIKEIQNPVNGLEFAKSISPSLAKKSIAIKINGEEKDLLTTIDKDCSLAIITTNNKEGLEIIRHSTAHLLADAFKELHPNGQVTIGPVIENGYYYDFDIDKPLTEDDLVKIEKKMQEIAKRKTSVAREEWNRDEAVEFFKSINEDYKAEIIASIPSEEGISLYRQGDFIDLCRGPHVPNLGYLKYFKLLKVSGAYWRGDSNNKMLQRVYGTAFATKEELEKHLHMLEEAEKRDHRKLGVELDLFHMSNDAVGSVFWHAKGWKFYTLLQDYIKNKLEQNGYQEVKTPIVVNKELWEKSGHWGKFKESMFVLEDEDREYAIKPMNCPCHIEIFKKGIKSYKDLPIRMAEFGSCHRNEPSGALHGLMRLRGFTQDDAHIFCTEDQITSETIGFIKLLKEVYKDLGFETFRIKFSDRPEVRAGSDETWDKTEKSLKDAIDAAGYEYELNKGEGAFYGPKLEFVLTDAIGRDWQCGTIQVDSVLPERLGATYIDNEGNKQRPVILHRAILGSFERFIGMFIENCAGRFPFWLAPVQAVVCTITEKNNDYANKVYSELKKQGFRVEIDTNNDKIGYKVRKYMLQKIPYLITVGDKEEQNNELDIRQIGSQETVKVGLSSFKGFTQNNNK